MYYRHSLDYTYPSRSDEHMIEVKKVRNVVFDESYPYLQKGVWFGVKRCFYWVFMNALAFPLCRLTHGLKIYGRENIKKNKEVLKGGAITIANHVFMWDFMCVLKSIRPHLTNFPAWKVNLDGPNGPAIRLSGGIPVPTGSIRCMKKFNEAIEEVLQKGKWLHFYPEGSMWYYYPDIRPLKKAVFKYAVKYDKPIIPITMSFRPRKGITKLFTNCPCVDLHVGEPMFADKSLHPKEAERKLHREAYHIMQVMNGINPGDPTYNTDQCIDNYVSTM